MIFDNYKKKLIELDTENIERELIRVEEELKTRFGASREALAERKLERANRREQLRQVEHDGKELQMLDHQSHDDSREIARVCDYETEQPASLHVRSRWAPDSHSKITRAQRTQSFGAAPVQMARGVSERRKEAQ